MAVKGVPPGLGRRRIGVISGGRSGESGISRLTGKAVLNGLRRLGLRAAGLEADSLLPQRLKDEKIGFAFIALHGRFGEDGTVQGLCQAMGIPYSGSGVLASALAMNKALSKEIFRSAGIRTARSQVLDRPDGKIRLKYPVVVKPVDGGSALGVGIAAGPRTARSALKSALRVSGSALVEEYVRGTEVTAPILGDRVLPLIEIIPKGRFYDFRSKYVPGMSSHIIPARIGAPAAAAVREAALAAHRALGCRAFSRADFIVDRAGRPWILELNSIPGMTATSLFPEAARAAGIPFEKMLLDIIAGSLPPG